MITELQRFAIESAMQSGKSFRIESDGTLVFDVQGVATSVGRLAPSLRELTAPKDSIYRRVTGPANNRLTLTDILLAAAKVGESIKIKATDSGVRLAAKQAGMTGKYKVSKAGVTTFTRLS